MVPDDTLNLLGYRGRISVYDDEENSNSAVGEDASVDEGNNNNNSNNNINNTVDNNNSNKISNNVDSGASSAVNKEEGRVNAEEELKRTKKMLEGVRKELDDERRMREAADEPEMPRETPRPDRDDSPDSLLLSVNKLPDDDDGNVNLAARGDDK